jgi:hypothetical protein
MKFRSLESSSTGASSDVLLPDWATNAWAMGASVDDVPTLSSLDRGGMGHGHHHQCTFTQYGHDLLRVLPTEATTQETVVTNMSATSRAEKSQGRKIGQSRMPNQTIQFPWKQQHLVASKSRRHPMGILLINREAFRGRQGQGARLRPMMKRSPTRREV